MDQELTTNVTLTHTDIEVLCMCLRMIGDGMVAAMQRKEGQPEEELMAHDLGLVCAVGKKLALKRLELEAQANLDFTANVPEKAYETHHLQ